MTRIFFYTIIKPLSYLPLSLLYGISNIVFFIIYHVAGYRKSVVRKNLLNSFPEKSRGEILKIEKDFFRHLCDLIIESVKLFSISQNELQTRFTLRNPNILDEYRTKNQSLILVMGHFNNWELTGTSLNLHIPHQVKGIYQPLSNKFFEKAFSQSRTKFGSHLIPKSEVRQSFIRYSNDLTMIVFGIDQSPTYSKQVHWTSFLNQDTAVHVGAELFAKLYNYPVFFMDVHKIKRGYYAGDLVLLTDHPQNFAEGELSALFTKHLEKLIIEKPEFWIWSHKRWKRKKPEDNSSTFSTEAQQLASTIITDE